MQESAGNSPASGTASQSLPNQERERRLLWLGIVAITLTTSLASYMTLFLELRSNPSHLAADFLVFWTASQSAAPYDFLDLTAAQHWYVGDDAIRPFAYPPSFLPWLVPFGTVPMLAGFAAWVILTGGLFASAWSRIVGWRLSAAAIVTPTVLLAAIPGQVTFLIGAMIAGGLALIERRPLLAGTLLGVAATIKPQALLLLPVAMAAGGHWRSLAAAVASGTLAGLAFLALQGPSLWFEWLSSLPGFMAVIRDGGMIHFGITPSSAVAQAGIGGIAAQAFVLAAATIGLLTVGLVFRWSKDVSLRLLGLCAGTLLVLPYAMSYELAAAAPAALALLFTRDRNPAAAAIGLLASTAVAGTLGLLMICGLILWLVSRGDFPAAPAAQPQTA